MKNNTSLTEDTALLAYATSEGRLKRSIAELALAKRNGTLGENAFILAYIALAPLEAGNSHDGVASAARNARTDFNTRCLTPALILAAKA